MKRTVFITLAVLLLCVGAYAALTNSASNILTNIHEINSQSASINPIYLTLNEIEDILEGTTAVTGLQLTSPTVTTPTITGGSIASPTITTPTLTAPVSTVAFEVNDVNYTLTTAQTGLYLFCTTGQDVNLPDATGSGNIFYIVDANAAAGADLVIYPEPNDAINGDTAGEYIKCETDADGTMATLIDVAANTWYAIYTQAAWTEE